MSLASLSILPRSVSIVEAYVVLGILLYFVAGLAFRLSGIVLGGSAARTSPDLPPELLDHIVDFLCDSKRALSNCCLISKSWIPHTRRHLFAKIVFHEEATLESWREAFPDPSTSLACHVKTLSIYGTHAVRAAGAEAGGWIRGFSRVTRLEVDTHGMYVDELMISLVPFHGLSPTVESLCVIFDALPPLRIFNLILSFPLLENLTVINNYGTLTANGDDSVWLPTVVQPPSTPVFTGSLRLFMEGGMKSIASLLLSLPGGIHFRKLALKWSHEEDLLLGMALVERCCHTLESLDITRTTHGKSTRDPRLHK